MVRDEIMPQFMGDNNKPVRSTSFSTWRGFPMRHSGKTLADTAEAPKDYNLTQD